MTSVEVEPTPYEVGYTGNKLRLRYYEADADRGPDVPVVFASALSNIPTILDLSHGRSVVGQFLDRGFNVYLIDWGEPLRLDVHLSLSDYVVRYLDNCVDVVRERSETGAVHVVGSPQAYRWVRCTLGSSQRKWRRWDCREPSRFRCREWNLRSSGDC